jgi:hypothetical protein
MRTFRVSKVEFDSAKKIVETDTEIIVPTIFTRESILPFEDGRGYRSAEQLKKYGWTLEDAWLVAFDHIPTVFPTDPEQVRGKAKNVKFCSKINGLVGDSCFFKSLCDQPFQEDLKKGKLKDVSVAYFSEDVRTPGKFGDEPYDFAQTKFFFGHCANGVIEGRCPSPYCGMSVDSLFAKPHADPEQTANFIHIPIRDKALFVSGMDRTITLSASEGIEAVIGKLQSDPSGPTHIQKYIFRKDKGWTMDKAQAWVKQHKDAFTLEEIKAKIVALNSQRQQMMEKLYPKTSLSEEEQRKLHDDLTVLDAEMEAFTELLAENLGVSGPNAGPGSTGPGVDAAWTTQYVNNLPDECFAYIESGGKKDAEGKTVPRSLRHLEFKNDQRQIDHAHLVAALAALGGAHTGSPPSYAGEAKGKLCAAVSSWNKANPDAKIQSAVCGTDSSVDSCVCSLEAAWATVDRTRRLLSSQ